jgi:hypothetical protein
VLSKYIKIRIYKTIILPVVLYGCETLSLTFREEHRLRVFENRMLKRIFGPKRDEVNGENCITKSFVILGKPKGKRSLETPRRRWVDKSWMDLGEVGWSDVDWIGLTQDRNRWRALVNSVLNLQVP